jgi:outer membrane protein W
MNRYLYSFLFCIVVGLNSVNAQGPPSSAGNPFDIFYTFAWDVNFPLGDKFVDAASYAGAKFEIRKMIGDNLSVGLDLSWNSYYEYKAYQTFHASTGTDVTTDLFKYNYTLPIAATAHYYFPSAGGIFIPYVGLGLGATYSTPRIYANIYEFQGENWGFLVRPELGTVIKFNPDAGMGVLVGARYSYSTNEEPVFKIQSLQSIGFQLGLVWLY